MKKYKLKTHKGLKNRFKLTATGKVTRTTKRSRKYGYSHKKSNRNVDKKTRIVAKPESKRIKRLLTK